MKNWWSPFIFKLELNLWQRIPKSFHSRWSRVCPSLCLNQTIWVWSSSCSLIFRLACTSTSWRLVEVILNGLSVWHWSSWERDLPSNSTTSSLISVWWHKQCVFRIWANRVWKDSHYGSCERLTWRFLRDYS